MRKQYAWLLWHGKIALRVCMVRRIHGAFGVPLEVLLQVTRATPPKRRGCKPAQTPPRNDRSDGFGWSEGDITITPPPEEEDV